MSESPDRKPSCQGNNLLRETSGYRVNKHILAIQVSEVNYKNFLHNDFTADLTGTRNRSEVIK